MFLVYGSVSDKDVAAAVRLLPRGAKLLLTAAGTPRAMRPEAILSLIRAQRDQAETEQRPAPGHPGKEPVCFGSVAEAVSRALAAAAPEDLVYIGGSTYVVAEALQFLKSL